MASLKNKRIGYWVTDKKYKKLDIQRMETVCRDLGIILIKLNLEEDFEKQGPFDLIFHKITDLLTKGNEEKITFDRFQTYALSHGEVVLIDAPSKVRPLLTRTLMYHTLIQCPLLNGGARFFVPSSVELLKVEDAVSVLESHSISFPIVCKPSLAVHVANKGASDNDGEMAIVFNEEGLAGVTMPCFAQSFINHNAMLLKVYVVGQDHYQVRRPSIRNLYPHPNKPPIHFNSTHVSKSYSSSPLNNVSMSSL